MRLKNIPCAKKFIKNNEKKYFINIKNNKKINIFDYFKNYEKTNLEIGSGKGLFITNLSKKKINQNFICIEKINSILFFLLKNIIKNKNKNIKIINNKAENLNNIFLKNQIDNIYINFPDPWFKTKHSKRRLINNNFLKIYKNLLKKNGKLLLKTDKTFFFNFSIKKLKENNWKIIYLTNNLYKNKKNIKKYIKSEYELKFLDKKKIIKYLIAKP